MWREVLTGRTAMTFNYIDIAGTDLNSYSKMGIFYFSSSTTPNNIPEGLTGGGWCIVLENTFQNNQLFCRQIWLSLNLQNNEQPYDIYIRAKHNGVWKNWYKTNICDCVSFSAGTFSSLADLKDYVNTLPRGSHTIFIANADAAAIGLDQNQYFLRILIGGTSGRAVFIDATSSQEAGRRYVLGNNGSGWWSDWRLDDIRGGGG